MATDHDCQIILDALRGLCAPLHGAGQRAWDLADQTYTEFEMPEDEYRGGRAHLGRNLLRRELLRSTDLGGWKVDRRPRLNGAIKLSSETMELKLLRPGPARGTVPHPGPSKARIYYYRNPGLNLFGAEGSKLIGVWEVEPKTMEFGVRLVRPIDAWKPFKSEKIDIDLVLPREGDGMDGVEFVPSDDDLPFFPFEVSEDEGDEGAGE